MLTPHAALIYAMVIVSGSDRTMTDEELALIGDEVTHLPVFSDYNKDQLIADARACGTLVRQDNGFRKALDAIAAALPAHLRETCYLLACDVAGSSAPVGPEEARVLQLLRQALKLDRLTTVALERATRARWMALHP
ncbi:MAG TPA: tellurite resistance TerB family protein [Kiloniellales bacterium]|nr:tellurite resistance TerB family protein [Kiloniellales bacterium]